MPPRSTSTSRTSPVASLNGSGAIGDSFNTGTNTLTVGVDNASGTFSGTIYGAGGYGYGTGNLGNLNQAPITLLKVGTGTQLLTGTSSTYSAGTTIAGGILGIAGDGSLGSTGTNATTTLTFSGNSTLQAEAAGIVLSSSRLVTINNGVTGTIDTHGNNMTILGQIGGAGNLYVTDSIGGGTLILSAADNDYMGATEVNAGTLEVLNSGALPYGTALTVDTNGAVDIGDPPGAGPSVVVTSSFAAPHAGRGFGGAGTGHACAAGCCPLECGNLLPLSQPFQGRARPYNHPFDGEEKEKKKSGNKLPHSK